MILRRRYTGGTMSDELSVWGKARRRLGVCSLVLFGLAGLSGCASSSEMPDASDTGSANSVASDAAAAKDRIAWVLDDWHKAAAEADEERYFGHFAPDAVFMGTAAKERWSVKGFRAYAHPHFTRGKSWSFRAMRRVVQVDGKIAWFDEDLATSNLGPARGSGVLRHDGKQWRIVHYNLTITVPNERFLEVKQLLEQPVPNRN